MSSEIQTLYVMINGQVSLPPPAEMNYIQVSSVSSGAETAAVSALRSVLSSEGGPNSSEDGDDGAAIVDVSAQRLSGECTHLVVGARLRKTEKVLEAMARGDVKIVSVRWARACVAKGTLVPEDPYLIAPSSEYPHL